MGFTQNMSYFLSRTDMRKPVQPVDAAFMESSPLLWLLEDPPDCGADMQKVSYCGDPKFLKSKSLPNFVEVNHTEGVPTNLDDDDDEDDDDQAFVAGEEFFFLDAIKVEFGCANVSPSKACPHLLPSQNVANTGKPLYQNTHAKIEAELSCDNRGHSKMGMTSGDMNYPSSEDYPHHEDYSLDFCSQHYGMRCNVPLDHLLLSPDISCASDSYSNLSPLTQKTNLALCDVTPPVFSHLGKM